MKMQLITRYIILLLIPMFSACIDEDLSDCPPPVKHVMVDYQIDLTHEVDQQYHVRLQHLQLGFWNAPTHLFHKEYYDHAKMPQDLIFHVCLPIHDYAHIAVANQQTKDHKLASFPHHINQFVIRGEYLAQDTVRAFGDALLVGRDFINLASMKDKTHYQIWLKPVAAQVKIKVSKPDHLTNLRCLLQGTMAGYLCWQNQYQFHDKLVTVATDYKKAGATADEFDFYCFPTVQETSNAVRIPQNSNEGKWHIYFYTDCNGRVLQHRFTITEPLRAGQVFEAEFHLTEQGGNVNQVDASVQVDTDWHPGDSFEQEI